MERERIRLEPTTPWSLWLFDRLPGPAAAIGVALGLGLYAVFLLYTTAFGAGPGRLLLSPPAENFWLGEIIQCLLIGLAPAVSAASIRGSLRDFRELRHHLDADDDALEALRGDLLRYPRLPLLAVGMLALALVGAFVFTDPGLWVGGVRPPLGHPDLTWLLLRNGLLGWAVARGMWLELTHARAFSNLGGHLVRFDLLDRAPLRVFGRRALRSVLLWMLFVSFFSLMYAGGWAADILAPALVAIVAFAFAAFLLPVLGARRRVRERKAAELSRVRAEIRDARDRVVDAGPAAPLEGGRLADLVAYEQRVDGISEWPFDGNTVVRFALYLGLGAGSWIGAALVEHALEAALR